MRQLTRGAVEAMMNGRTCDKPTLQVLGHKKLSSAQGPERFRLLLSDGEHSWSSAMLATQLNNLITSGQLEANTIICLNKYICNSIQNEKRVLILLELTVLEPGSSVGCKIGNPQPLRVTSDNNDGPADVPVKQEQPMMQPSHRPDFNRNNFQPTMNLNNSNATPKPVQTKVFPGYGMGNQVRPTATRPAAGGSSGVEGGETPTKVHPINTLTPYQNRWTIKARVTHKSALRKWSNSKGEGTLFDMTFLDESGDIRATAFKNEAEKFFNMIEVNKVYYVRKASLKTANKQFSNTNNDYDMTFTAETEVIECDNDSNLPTVTFNFIPINQLDAHQPGTIIDVMGVVKEVDELRTIIAKQTSKEMQKRDVTLADETQVLVRLTLWGKEAETFDGTGNPILAIKSCKVSDWGGRSLSSVSSTQLIRNPDMHEAYKLRAWFDKDGTSTNYAEFKRDGGSGGANTNWKKFSEVKAQNLGQDKADYFTTKATIVHLKRDNCLYQACPQQSCNKKVIDQGNGNYRCEKCQKEYPDFKWRMMLNVNLADFTDNQWVTCFQDTAEIVLGKTADEIGLLRETDQVSFDQVFADATFKSHIFRMRAKMETFNDESRLKTVCMEVKPFTCTEYNHRLIADIEALLGPI